MKLEKFIKEQENYLLENVTIQNVIDTMIVNKVQHIVLLNNNSIPVGIITERDILFLYKRDVDFNKSVINYASKNLITSKQNRKIDYALNLMVDNDIRRVIVVDSNKKYLGSISQEEIIFEFEQDVYKSHIKIKELIKSSNKALYIRDTDSLEEAMNIMTKNNIGSVLVYKEDNIPIGIITESDIVLFAHRHIDVKDNVTLHMHFPIISFDENELLHNVVKTMKERNIRRVLIDNKKDNQFYVITSKDILNNLKGNYSLYLESKLRDSKNTFNLLDEIVLELFDYENEQIIHWFNTKARKLFSPSIDDEITSIIPLDDWDMIYTQIKNNSYKDDKIIELNKRVYKIAAIYTEVLNTSVIKVLFSDITDIINKNEGKVNIYKESLKQLPYPIAIIDDDFKIIFNNDSFDLDTNTLKNIFLEDSFIIKNDLKLSFKGKTIVCKSIDNKKYLLSII